MPTINEHENQEGYYILAHTPDTGNITYEIRDEGVPVVRKHGFKHGDEIPWPAVQSFKSLGIVSTDGSDTPGPNDLEPDPERIDTAELSVDEARKLLQIVSSQLGPSPEELAEIREILGISDLASIVEEISEVISGTIAELIEKNELPLQLDRNDHGSVETTAELSVATPEVESHDAVNLRIRIVSETPTMTEVTLHCIHLCGEHGIEGWHVDTGGEVSWDRKVAAVQQKAVILPELVSQLQASRFELGDPTEQLSPVVDSPVAES